ncbi:hypothetical protein ACJRO7_030030 [Eucalyptus globulus]|uniref:KIB1-4 beta-propeller domain-containing protein n=1 Tax=Eucalyptus globulus TaxID=34317 RepID=A0ABD3JDT7_EUCGL
MMRNWAGLPQELLELCSSNVPWLMLEHYQETLRRECFCLSCKQVHRVLMPEAKGKTCFYSQGWVLTLSSDWELHMLKNSLSRHNYIIKLPNLSKFLDVKVSPRYDIFSTKFVVSASPTTSLDDYMVMVIYERDGRLGLWKPGDKEWTEVNSPNPRNNIADVIFYKGCFVALDCDGRILRCDVNGPTPFQPQIIFKMPQRLIHWEHLDLVQLTTGHPLLLIGAYLVQSATGFLLLVLRWEKCELTRTFRFQVFEIDLNARTCIEVKSLENMSLFLGFNSSFCLEVDEKHHIKPNCIYFADVSSPRLSEEGGGGDMIIYHIEDCTTELYFMAMTYDHSSLPLWIKPSF